MTPSKLILNRYTNKTLKEKLEDKNKELTEANKSTREQNVDLIRKTIELTELRGQLEDKNADLENANEEITKLLKVKNDFMNQAAHDLRTPLTPILTLLPIIKDKSSDQKIKYDVGIVEKNAKYLNLLVEDLITNIKVEQGHEKLNFRKINLASIIDEVLYNNQTLIAANKIKVIKNIGPNMPKIMGNKLRLTEVHQNIIFNAIKFMHKTPKVLTITVSKMDKFINIKIQDTGIGMSKETQSKLFEPFFKADKSRHYTGSGLGLAICKRIIEDHGGKVWAESEGVGKGSAITFTIPI